MHALTDPRKYPAPIHMAVVGDSLAYGMGATSTENGLAYCIFRRVREERPGSTYANFGVPHSTMGDVLRAQIPQLRGSNAGLIVLIAGANDLRFTRDTNIVVRRFRKLLESIADAAPQAAVVAAGMPDVARTIAIPPLLKPAASRLCRRMNDAMRSVAADHGHEFIDLYRFTSDPLQRGMEYMCEDGYHPADFGHAEIAERALPAVLRSIS